ncbi:unnamed protein product [Spirodela intermedia]|uniref:Uncharacterized protein n=1 Tax=Spirodela intermedia TaxID=51605 RepID=A0A7I8LJY7_SPIIN|nr:unnamed protein product [Spirodela intermedia]
MLNASDNLVQLLCPVPRSSGAASSFPAFRRCFSGHGRFSLPIHLPPVLLPPQFPGWPGPPPTAIFLVFFLWSSLFLARLLVLRSVTTYQSSSIDRSEAEGRRDEGHWFAGNWPGEEDVVLEGEVLLSLSTKVTDEDTILAQQGEDGEDLTLSAMEDLAPLERPEEDETTEFPFEDEHSQVDSPAAPPASAIVTVEEKCSESEEKHHEEGKRSFSKEDDHDDEEIIVPAEHDAQLVGKDEEGGPAVYESSTVGSASNSSGEWKSSANLGDSETDHLFSSSSRRHSSKWESYALFRRYDEEMTFFDQLSAQMLSNADSLRMVRTQPTSMSERTAHKITAREKKLGSFRVAHRELEAAYVVQICLTWEALSWNYKLFRQAIAGEQGGASGFSARTAQQFQQFQVLLQRFIENEPYEDGRRPEVYARRRIAAPKLLQVPELHDWDDRNGEEEDSRVSATEFLAILEECISTFMEFLKVDRGSRWSFLRALLRRRPSSGGAALLLHVLRKVNEKKRRRLKDLLRRGSCPVGRRRRRQRRREEVMEVLMGLVDMMIVSRVLRMRNVSEDQLRWCQEKMSKVKVCDGQMQRDSSPLFFPVN